jgi:hypothetical protein
MALAISKPGQKMVTAARRRAYSRIFQRQIGKHASKEAELLDVSFQILTWDSTGKSRNIATYGKFIRYKKWPNSLPRARYGTPSYAVLTSPVD